MTTTKVKAPATLEEAKSALHKAEGILEKALDDRLECEAQRQQNLIKYGKEIKNLLASILDHSDTPLDSKTAVKVAAAKALKICDKLLRECD